MSQYCKTCNEKLIPGAMFCSMCGTKVEKEKKCKSCGTVLAQEVKFCHVCGEKYAEKGQYDNTQNNDASDMNESDKRKTILNILNNNSWQITKECGENVYVISNPNVESLFLIDLRDISNLNLKEEEMLFGIQGLKKLNLGMAKGNGWVGAVNDNNIYYITGGLELHQVKLDNMEDICLNCIDNWKRDNEGVLEVIKCLNGSIRILYYSADERCAKASFVLNENGNEIWKITEEDKMNVFRMGGGHWQYVEVEETNGKYQSQTDRIGLLDLYTGKIVIPCKYTFFSFCQEKASGKLIIIPCRIAGDEIITDTYFYADDNDVREFNSQEIQNAKEMGIEKMDPNFLKTTKNYKAIEPIKGMEKLLNIEKFANV